jgi:hypothetical protein
MPLSRGFSSQRLIPLPRRSGKINKQKKNPALKLQQMPKKAHTTLQAADNLAGNPLDSRRTRSQHEEPSHVFSASEPAMPMHCYMVQSTDPRNYNRVVGNPLWQAAM